LNKHSFFIFIHIMHRRVITERKQVLRSGSMTPGIAGLLSEDPLLSMF
jgi:hypothetical protein